MPSAVTAIFSADARPYQAELLTSEQATKVWSAKVQRNVAMALAQWRATGVAPNPMSHNLHESMNAAFNLNGVLRETLVVFREIGRGNWARVPGSLSLIAQYAGVLRYVLSPIGIGIISIVAATYYWVRHLRAVVTESRNLNEVFGSARQKYLDMAKALEDHHQAMMKAAESAADFAAWQQKLSERTESATDVINAEVAALREEAELRKQLARAQGKSQKDIDAMEQEQRKKELNVTTLGELEQKRQAELDKTAAEEAHAASESSIKSFDKKSGQKSDFEKTIRDAQTIYSQLDSKTAAKISGLTRTASGEGVTDKQISILTGQGPVPATFTKAQQMAEAKKELDELRNKEFGNLDVEGKKVRVSLNELDNIVKEAVAKQAFLNKEMEDLAEVNRQLKDAENTAKQKAEKSSAAVIELTKKRDELVKSIALHAKYDPLIEAADGMKKEKGSGYSLNQQQRIGAYAATPPDWSILLTNVKAIAQHTGHLKPPSSKPVGSQPTQYGPATHH